MLAASAVLAPALMHGQSAVVGSLGNFDAANFEGKDAYGMEIQIEGILPGDLSPSWCGNKFGCPTIDAYATGVYVRYKSPYDPVNKVFTAKTVPHAAGVPFGGTCYMGTAAYVTAGCDHFGVHVFYTASAKATTTAYRWMFEDPANPGTLIASTNNIFVPTPVYVWVPPAVPAAPPVLVATVDVPPPPPPPPAVPPQYGNATWMKVYKSELNREAILDELVTGNAVVPQLPAQIETEWVLLQPEPPVVEGNQRRRNRQQNQGGVNAGVRAVLRRYETYAYTGAYNPVNHQVICGGDGTCTIPQPGELGDMLTAQMVAANVAVPSLTVALTGNGGVSSLDKVISCGNKCTSTYVLGTVVSLTAKAGSNSTFTNWTGACTGTSLTCDVTITDQMNVGAVFSTVVAGGGGGGNSGGGGGSTFTLSVGRTNPGTVTSDLAGINCGSACSAKFAANSVVTLTSTPPAGKTFVNWSGGCSGTVNTCAVTLTKDTSVQAVFSK